MRRNVKILLLLLAGACFGPFFSGAIGSLFWESTSSRDDKDKVAARIYYATDFDPGYDSVINYSSKNCEEPADEPGWDVKLFAYSRYFQRGITSRYKEEVVSNLRQLPPPILGALDGCINGSPLSYFCSAYANQRVAYVIWSSETAKVRWLAEGEKNIRRAWPEWCVKASTVLIQ